MNLLKKIGNKKFISVLLVVVILFNVISPNIVTPKAYAIDIGGILLWPLTFLVSSLADAALGIISLVGGASYGDGIFINNIVYNEVEVFKVNIFDSSVATADPNKVAIASMLPSIQKWYVITRTIAIAASFVILVYVGIKIFLSTAAGDKAKYKSLLKDWLLSLLLIFAMHFIMAGILYAADALTNMIVGIANTGGISGSTAYSTLQDKAQAANFDSLVYAILQWVLLIITFVFIIIYAKRVIMIAFLTVFAPLVALSYSIDKIKDGQSQVLDKWMKEYVYTALMMPLDALLFTIIFDCAINMLDGKNIIFGVALIIGYLPLRGWFNEFLGTDKAKHGGAAAAGAAGAAVGSVMTKMQSSMSDKLKKSNADADKKKVGDGNKEGAHEIQQKSVSNPALAGGADKAKVSSPTSAALASAVAGAEAASNVAQANRASIASASLTAAEQRRANMRNALSTAGGAAAGAAKGAGKLYSKGLGTVAGLAVGAMTAAATGNVGAGFATGAMTAKFANSGGTGLGEKAVNGIGAAGKNIGSSTIAGAKSAWSGAKSIGAGVAGLATTARDHAMVGGYVNALAKNGSLDDIEDDEERLEATKWAIANTSEERFEQLYAQLESGEIDSPEEMDDIMFREAVAANKGEIRTQLADQRRNYVADTTGAQKAAAEAQLESAREQAQKAGAAAEKAARVSSSHHADSSAARREGAKARKKAESEIMSAAKSQIGDGGKADSKGLIGYHDKSMKTRASEIRSRGKK